MTAYTPIYNLPYVEASDLVASYPTVSEELAENVETAIAGSGGLSLIDEETFTSASSVSLNNVFTSTYDNYEIWVYFTSSPQADGRMRFRASGADNTTSNYQYQTLETQSTVFTGSRETGQSSAFVNGTGSSVGTIWRISVWKPQKAQPTSFMAHAYLTISGGYLRQSYGQFTQTTQFDGFSIYPTSSTYSGNLRVYGYKGA